MKREFRIFIVSAFLLLFSAAEMFLMHRCPDFFFPAYRLFSQRWIALSACLFSFMPYSVWDIGALCLIILFFVFLFSCIRKKGGFLRFAAIVSLVISILAFTALSGWLGNHYAPKLSREIALEVRKYTVEELYEAAEYYLLEAAACAPMIGRDAEGHALPQDLSELSVLCGAAYLPLARQYPVFQGSSLPVKRFSLIGEYLLYNGITGMFMPITGEASVPSHVPVIPMPFTMCHEAAHRLGIASEQEANFCAFLACISNSDPRLIYSGYWSAFSYCFSSLYQADAEKAAQLYHAHDDIEGVLLVQKDRKDTNEAYRKYDSPMQEVSDRINDTYLKTFSQESGIRSYGEVTDYLIAWRLNEK